MTEPVELHQAYRWDCPECGREVFGRLMLVERDSEEMDHLREEFGVEPYEEGEFLMYPKQVECPYCERRFDSTAAFGEGPLDEEDDDFTVDPEEFF